MNRIACTLSTPKRALKIALKNPTKIYNLVYFYFETRFFEFDFFSFLFDSCKEMILTPIYLFDKKQTRLFLSDIKKGQQLVHFHVNGFLFGQSNTIRDRVLFQVIGSGIFTLYTNIKLFL